MTQDTPRRGRRSALKAVGGLLAAPAIVSAQSRWKPDKPITIYNPFAAGGVTDLQLRYMADKVSRMLGQPVLVEIKAGAAGTLAPAQLMSARPDGHQLACMSINSLRYPHYQQVSWHPLRDFVYVTGLSSYTMGIVVRADAPWRTIEDLIAAGKREPEKFTYGTSGVGGSGNLMMIEIDQSHGDWVAVPFRGAAPNLQALLAGDIHFSAETSAWAEMALDGRVRPLALWMRERAARFPAVPTLMELGFPIDGESSYGIAGPRGMDPAVVAVLHDAFRDALHDPQHLGVIARFDMPLRYLDSADYAVAAAAHYEDERRTVQELGLKLG